MTEGGGGDAEHPAVIPMDLPSSPQVQNGPMTQARAIVIETEVTSLLDELPYDPRETWLLSQSECYVCLGTRKTTPKMLGMKTKSQVHG